MSESNYTTFVRRIQAASSLAECGKLDNSLKRLYDAGQLTTNQFKLLDLKILHKKIAIEDKAD